MALQGKEINELTRVTTVDSNTDLLVIDTGGVEANSITVANLVSGAGVTVPDATTSTKGKIQIATQQEVNEGLDNTKAVTPSTLANWSGGGSGGTGFPSLTWYDSSSWSLSVDGLTLTIADTSSANLVKVYKNGILLRPGASYDYTSTSVSLTFATALSSTDSICVEVF